MSSAQGKATLDSIDRRILRELSNGGRITNADLASRVGLSASACSRRVAELERTRVIQGYRAVLAPSAIGGGFTAYLGVGLSKHGAEELRAFEQAMADAAAVRECHNVTGTIEYLLRVEVADLDSYKRFHTEVLGTLPQVSTITS